MCRIGQTMALPGQALEVLSSALKSDLSDNQM